MKNGNKKMASSMKNNPKAGGYRKGSSWGKKGWYKGYWCDSSYELAFVVYNIEHDIKFQRNNETFPYMFNGSRKNYIPDFIMKDGTYIEIKGYESEQMKAKHQAFPHKLQVLKQKDLAYAFEYVIGKYGKNYIDLYD